MLTKPLAIPQLYDAEFNNQLANRLQKSAEWRLCLDEHYLPGLVTDQYSDTGLVYYTYTQDRDWYQIAAQDPARGYFNHQAEQILQKALKHLGLCDATILRVMWNYYNRASQGVLHSDHADTNLYSMVYNLSQSDGGTEILTEFYAGNQGSALLFPSHYQHRGFGPRQQPRRFVLNCVFSLRDSAK